MTTEFARQDLAGNSSVPSPSENPERVRVIREGVASYLPDIDPDETGEWLESFDGLLARSGPARARYLMLRLLERANAGRVAIPALTSTDYVNTIPTENEPWFPGDEDTERRFRAWIRWNAAIMVHRAQRPGVGVGGHISTYASSAALYEVGFNHFFREMPTRAAATRYSSRATPPRHLRPCLPGGPAHHRSAGRIPPGEEPPRRRPTLLPASAPDARFLAVPNGFHGAGTDERDHAGAVQPLPS